MPEIILRRREFKDPPNKGSGPFPRGRGENRNITNCTYMEEI